MTEPSDVLLTVESLQVSYGAIKALHDVSLQIHSGEIVTLIGANGAGKTTLLRTISGLLRPSTGAIRWKPGQPDADIRLQTLAAHEIVRLGISHVPEGRQIFTEMTVRENLQLGAYARKSGRAAKKQLQNASPPKYGEIDDIYRLFPVLGERFKQKAGTLSGGEQQMLAIGRALMAHPRLLLLDEPSLGLAPLVVRKIFDIIRQINQAGMTIFLVEQNARMALSVANRAYVLQTGHVIKTDQASNLLDDPEVKKAYLGG